MYQANAHLLKFALISNAVFSTICAIFMVVGSVLIANLVFETPETLLGIGAIWFVLSLGGGLLGFATLVAHVATRAVFDRKDVIQVVAADLIWVIGSMAALWIWAKHFTNTGTIIILIIGGIVLLLAFLQSVGLLVLYQGASKISVEGWGISSTIVATKTVNVDQQTAWQIISDLEGYADVAKNIAKVEVLSGETTEAIRRCWDNDGNSWTENATHWVEGKSYGFQVNTDAQDYPYPIERLEGSWSLSPLATNQTEVGMEFKVVRKTGFKSAVIGTIISLLFAPTLDELLAKWEKKMLMAAAQ